MYRVTGSREAVNRLVASLSGVWQNSFESAALRVDRPGDSAGPVVVEAITPEQTANVVAQSTTKASIEAALSYAAMNRLAKNHAGQRYSAADPADPGPLLAALSIPHPRETGPDNGTRLSQAPVAGKAEVNLTIVLLDARGR